MVEEEREGTPKVHPLEGKYIIYYYGEQDEDERWALALFRLQGGEMVEVYKPATCFEWGEIDEEKSNGMLLDLMKKQGISSVYSVFHTEDFFGIPAGWKSLSEEGEVADNWYEYQPVCTQTYESSLLEDHGIQLCHHIEN